MQPQRIDDLVFATLAGGHRLQGAHQHAAVIGVGSGAGSDLAQQVTRGNGVSIGAANPQMSFRGYAAGAHMAQAAANAVGAKLALRFLQLVTVKDRAHLGIIGNLDHIDRCLIHRDRLPRSFVTRGRHQFFSCWAENNLANKSFIASRAGDSGEIVETGTPSASRAATSWSKGTQASKSSPVAWTAAAIGADSTPPGTRFTISPRCRAGNATSSASAEMRPAVRMPRTVQSETISR